jgi:hypothetical protein
MEDEDGWEHLKKHLLARLARAGLAGFHGLRPRDMCERVVDGMYRIWLRERISRLVPRAYEQILGTTDLDVELE